jgi:hypothetical protein
MDKVRKPSNSESHSGQLVSQLKIEPGPPEYMPEGYRLYHLVELFLTERRCSVLTRLQAEEPMKSGFFTVPRPAQEPIHFSLQLDPSVLPSRVKHSERITDHSSPHSV